MLLGAPYRVFSFRPHAHNEEGRETLERTSHEHADALLKTFSFSAEHRVKLLAEAVTHRNHKGAVLLLNSLWNWDEPFVNQNSVTLKEPLPDAFLGKLNGRSVCGFLTEETGDATGMRGTTLTLLDHCIQNLDLLLHDYADLGKQLHTQMWLGLRKLPWGEEALLAALVERILRHRTFKLPAATDWQGLGVEGMLRDHPHPLPANICGLYADDYVRAMLVGQILDRDLTYNDSIETKTMTWIRPMFGTVNHPIKLARKGLASNLLCLVAYTTVDILRATLRHEHTEWSKEAIAEVLEMCVKEEIRFLMLQSDWKDARPRAWREPEGIAEDSPVRPAHWTRCIEELLLFPGPSDHLDLLDPECFRHDPAKSLLASRVEQHMHFLYAPGGRGYEQRRASWVAHGGGDGAASGDAEASVPTDRTD